VDLALVCVASPLTHIFEWAHEFKRGDPVLAAGPNYNGPLDQLPPITVECLAGKILALSTQGGVKPDRLRISSDAPLHGGDSGGPLILRNGRLVGINAQGLIVFGRSMQVPFLPRAYSYRPNPESIKAIIDEDFARRSSANSGKISR
jgi:S1-C subfamily serine protease